MTPFAAAIARSLVGAFIVVRGDSAGLTLIDRSVGGARLAFLHLLFTVPVAGMIAVLIGLPQGASAQMLMVFALISSLADAAAWAGHMLLFGSIADRLGQSPRLPAFVAVYGWSRVWQSTVELIALMVVLTGILGAASGWALLGIEALLLFWTWRIGRMIFGWRGLAAAAPVVTRIFVTGLVNLAVLLPFYARLAESAPSAG